MKELFYRNRKMLVGFTIVLLAFGIIYSYLNYGKNPQETIGGFICGISLGLLVIFAVVKKPES